MDKVAGFQQPDLGSVAQYGPDGRVELKNNDLCM